MSKVRITLDLEEIKTLCNALIHVSSQDLEEQDPRSMVFVDRDKFDQLKTLLFSGKSFLLYPRIYENDHVPNLEVIT